MKLSILIPVYNEEKTIIDVLQRIKKTKVDDIDYEIIVINDGSTDGTKKLLEENNTLYNSLINNSRNSGKGFSVKQGLKISTGEYIIFVHRTFALLVLLLVIYINYILYKL